MPPGEQNRTSAQWKGTRRRAIEGEEEEEEEENLKMIKGEHWEEEKTLLCVPGVKNRQKRRFC